ncbi:MAG: hypothetical protein ACOCRK_08070 [bacterium]
MSKVNIDPIKSKLIYNLGNNLITIGSLNGDTDILDRYENFFVGEVINEITHLPYDTVLIPFLKKLSIDTVISDPDEVHHIRAWDIENSYLNENRDGHIDGLSIQPDTSIILEDYVIFFEFKKPHTAPSQNKMTIKELGRQILLAIKISRDYNINNYKIIIINNSAPKVHIPNLGKVNPNEIVARYFEEKEDKWLEHKSVKDLIKYSNINDLNDKFIVLTWQDFIEKAIFTIQEANKMYTNKGIKRLLENSCESLKWYLERREDKLY